MDIEQVKLDKLIPYARNSRTHSDAQVAQIAASIKEFGFTNPVLIDETGSIIAGHGRVMAARKLAITDIPSIRLTHLTEAQKKAYVIADNKLALNAGWDDEMLAVELTDLKDMDFNLDLTGFTLDELKGVQELDGMPELPTGDKEPFQQMTFTLHDTQAEQVGAAMDAAKQMGKFIDSPNENGNGNALARICETFLTQNGNG
jgi:hypothetical protein